MANEVPVSVTGPGQPRVAPTLMEYLLAQYDKADMTDTGSEKRRHIGEFAAFAEQFLTTNRITGTWYPPSGVGLMFTNLDRVRVSHGPVAAKPGSIKGAINKPKDVPVTRGDGYGG